MKGAHWGVIGILALAAFGIRFIGLIAGSRISGSRFAWVLDEIPGLIVISLVAASLAGQSFQTWIAAAVAVAVAALTNHVIATMIAGAVVYAGLAAIWP